MKYFTKIDNLISDFFCHSDEIKSEISLLNTIDSEGELKKKRILLFLHLKLKANVFFIFFQKASCLATRYFFILLYRNLLAIFDFSCVFLSVFFLFFLLAGHVTSGLKVINEFRNWYLVYKITNDIEGEPRRSQWH
jgi:hypothetical protein